MEATAKKQEFMSGKGEFSRDFKALVFLTDWASYNNGSQFEFGHWVDVASFEDEDDFSSYCNNHFAEDDEKNPLCTPREEWLSSDIDGVFSNFYDFLGENLDIHTYFKIIRAIEDKPYLGEEIGDNLGDWLNEFNEAFPDDFIFDDYYLDDYIDNLTPAEAFQLARNSNLNYNHAYHQFNGYGNLESLDDFDIEKEIKSAKYQILEGILTSY